MDGGERDAIDVDDVALCQGGFVDRVVAAVGAVDPVGRRDGDVDAIGG